MVTNAMEEEIKGTAAPCSVSVVVYIYTYRSREREMESNGRLKMTHVPSYFVNIV